MMREKSRNKKNKWTVIFHNKVVVCLHGFPPGTLISSHSPDMLIRSTTHYSKLPVGENVIVTV